jgi:hypothetical protein
MNESPVPRSLRARVAPALLVLVTLAACVGERDSPTAAFASLRAAMAAGDGARVLALHDPETRAFRMQRVRTIRARLEQGEDITAVLGHDRRRPEEFLEGTVEEVVARDILTLSMVADTWGRLRDAEVLGEEIEQTPEGRARRGRLRVRYSDGEEAELYFVEAPSGWKFDQFRAYQVRMNER